MKDLLETSKFFYGELTISLLRNGEIIKQEKIKNTIVNKASELLALLLKSNNSSQKGIEYVAVGTGFGTGTSTSPQSPSLSDVKLKQEIFRKTVTSVVNNNSVTFSTTFSDSEAVGQLVEAGLFGGTVANSSTDSGFLFSYKTFSAWNKPNNAELKIDWTITF